MNFSPKQHLKIGNYIKYVDEILKKCDKGIEYCKICPNEFVCSELEKDDFGLRGTTISDILTAIHFALNKIPGYINPDKRKELKDHIKSYINESPLHEREIWEDGIMAILLDDKLANPMYKPIPKIGKVRTLLTYNSKISFSTCIQSAFLKNISTSQDTTVVLPEGIFSHCIEVANQFIRSKRVDRIDQSTTNRIKYLLEVGVTEIISGCNIQNAELPAAVCYYAMVTKQPIPGNIVVTGGMDEQGKTIPSKSLDDAIEVVSRELHFIEKIIVAKNSPISIPVPNKMRIFEVDNFEQTIDIIQKKRDLC